jgi:predicted acetyltransferase
MGDGGAGGIAGEVRRPRAEERAAFADLQRRGYAWGAGTLEPAPEPGDGPREDGARACFAGGRPVAGAYLKPYRTWWGEDELPMESVGGVVALPEARRRGHTAALMAGLVADMRERGVPISTITTPFSYAFYRRVGWEYAFPRLQAQLPPRALAALGGGEGEARFVRADASPDWLPAELDAVYRRAVRSRYQGAAARPADLWREHLAGERTYAYAWHGDAGPRGYLVASAERGRTVRVRELFALDRDAYAGLCSLLSNLDSQAERLEWDLPPDARLDLLVPEQHGLELAWRPQGMLRIVDLAAAVAGRGAPGLSGAVRLRLQDEQAPWNRGPFDLVWTEGRAEVRPASGTVEPGAEAAMDQRTFAQIYAGTLTPAAAAGLGRAEVGPRALSVLAAAYVTGRPPLLLESH